MVKIKWTHNAIEELDDIAYYISKDSPKYALILVKQIYEMISHLVRLVESANYFTIIRLRFK